MNRLLAAVTGLMALAALVIGAPPARAEVMTTITMSVTGCEGCVIVPAQSGLSSDQAWQGISAKARVRDGVATLTVPTALTTGMSFLLQASWRVEINAQPLIVFQYQGAPVGGRVSKAQAMSARRASPCWAGTAGSQARMRVVVRRVTMPAFDPESASGAETTQVPMAWTVPTRTGLTPFWPVHRGVLAVQDSVDCAVG